MKAATTTATTAKMKVAMAATIAATAAEKKIIVLTAVAATAALKSGRKLRFARLCYKFRKCAD